MARATEAKQRWNWGESTSDIESKESFLRTIIKGKICGCGHPNDRKLHSLILRVRQRAKDHNSHDEVDGLKQWVKDSWREGSELKRNQKAKKHDLVDVFAFFLTSQKRGVEYPTTDLMNEVNYLLTIFEIKDCQVGRGSVVKSMCRLGGSWDIRLSQDSNTNSYVLYCLAPDPVFSRTSLVRAKEEYGDINELLEGVPPSKGNDITTITGSNGILKPSLEKNFIAMLERLGFPMNASDIRTAGDFKMDPLYPDHVVNVLTHHVKLFEDFKLIIDKKQWRVYFGKVIPTLKQELELARKRATQLKEIDVLDDAALQWDGR